MFLPTMTKDELDELRTITTDKTVPAKYRADLTDWLGRLDEINRARRDARAEVDTRRAALRRVEVEVRGRVIAAAAAKMTKQTERTVASDLDKAHRSLSDLDYYRETLDKSTPIVENNLRIRIPIEHLDELVPWVATQRVEHDWWTPPTGTVALVWGSIVGHVGIELPLDAWETSPGVFTPEPLRLVLNLNETRAELVDRIVYAWVALAAGQYERTTTGRFKITADWSTRTAVPLRPPVRGRRLGFGFRS
jgi:hypothetical protein